MTGEERSALDTQLRTLIKEKIGGSLPSFAYEKRGANAQEIVFLLTRMLPELCDRDYAMGQLMAAFDLAAERAVPGRLVYCKFCHKTHGARPGEDECAPGAWIDA